MEDSPTLDEIMQAGAEAHARFAADSAAMDRAWSRGELEQWLEQLRVREVGDVRNDGRTD